MIRDIIYKKHPFLALCHTISGPRNGVYFIAI